MDKVVTCGCGGKTWTIGTSGTRCAGCGFWLKRGLVECPVEQTNEHIRKEYPEWERKRKRG